MSTREQRISANLDVALSRENAYNADINPFAAHLKQQRDAYVSSRIEAWRADPANADRTNADTNEVAANLGKQFDNDKDKLGALTEQLKTNVKAVYANDKEALDMGNAAQKTMEGVTNGLLMGDVSGGLQHGLMGAFRDMPFVKEFFGQLMTWIKSKFSGESLSWQEAGEVNRDANGRERVKAAFSGADAQKLDALLTGELKPPARQPRQAAPEKKPEQATAAAPETKPEIAAAEASNKQESNSNEPKKTARDIPIPEDAKLSGVSNPREATPDDHAAAPPPSTQTVSPEALAAAASQSAAR